jgi:hypothetical protein
MIDTNQLFVDFVGKNWMLMLIVYAVVREMLPDSKILKALGEAVSNLFPVLKNKGA